MVVLNLAIGDVYGYLRPMASWPPTQIIFPVEPGTGAEWRDADDTTFARATRIAQGPDQPPPSQDGSFFWSNQARAPVLPATSTADHISATLRLRGGSTALPADSPPWQLAVFLWNPTGYVWAEIDIVLPTDETWRDTPFTFDASTVSFTDAAGNPGTWDELLADLAAGSLEFGVVVFDGPTTTPAYGSAQMSYQGWVDVSELVATMPLPDYVYPTIAGDFVGSRRSFM